MKINKQLTLTPHYKGNGKTPVETEEDYGYN